MSHIIISKNKIYFIQNQKSLRMNMDIKFLRKYVAKP
jgi:hypothetical protein